MTLLYKSALFSKVWNYICSNIASRCRNIALVFIQGSGKMSLGNVEVVLVSREEFGGAALIFKSKGFSLKVQDDVVEVAAASVGQRHIVI